MASLRKKYQPHVEGPDHRDDDAPVTTAPTTAAAPPPAVDHPEPPPVLEEQPPEETAARNAIQSRLAEMQQAEHLAHQPVQAPRAPEPPRQPKTIEDIIDQCELGEHAKAWLRNHPEFVTDRGRNQQIVYLHDIAKRKSGGEYTPRYFQVMDDLLGFEPAGNGRHLLPNEPASPPYNGAARPQAPMPAPRQPAHQRFASQPPAAPPTREVPSMRTGRPLNHSPPLTELERDIARQSFTTTKNGISPDDQYRAMRDKLKKDGIIGGTGYGR
jgi:hypothetical protein